MTFELFGIEATLKSVTPRTESNGDDDVFAVSLGFKITAVNTILDRLAPALRDSLYKAVDGQEQLPGIDPSTPLLRVRGIESLTLAGTFEGWTLAVAHGIDEDEPITLGGAKVDKFKVAPHEGGSVDLSFRVSSSDIDATEAGLLCAKLSQSVSITLTAPVKMENQAIDGSVGAFKADHPESDLFTEPDPVARDATEMFAAQHGQDGEGGPGAGDSDNQGGADSEGGETDITRGDGESWPFPGTEAASSAANAAAELEAGMAESMAEAGLTPKAARRPRRAGAGAVE